MVLASTGTGDIIPDATVTVRNPGTTTNISETIFANDDPDTTQLTNGVFKTDARGLAIFYLTNQKRVDVLFTKAGVTSVTIPVDVQKSSLVSGYATFQDEGVAQTQRGIANFIGAGVTLTDDSANGRTNVTIKPVATDPIWDAAGDLVYGTGADAASRLAIGTAGQVLKVNSGATAPEWGAAAASSFVGARAHRTTNQTITTATNTAVALTAEGFDTDAFHDNATNNSRFTVPAGKAGKYRVHGQVEFASNATGIRHCNIYKNGTEVSVNRRAAGATVNDQNVTDILDLAVGDYVEIYVYQDSGGNLDIVGASSLTYATVEYLGA